MRIYMHIQIQAALSKRHNDLKLLIDFMKNITQEIIWINQCEESEVSRDWSDKDMNLGELKIFHEVS